MVSRPLPILAALTALAALAPLGSAHVAAPTAHDSLLDAIADARAAAEPDAAARDPGGVRTAPAPPWHPLALGNADDDAPVAMRFVCPTGQPQNTDATDRTIVGCPIRVYDTQNPFGNPSLAILPDDPRMVSFFALHGGATESGPHDYSRRGQTHTTFSSPDQGISWDDQPTGHPEESDVFGETASGTMDAAGNQYIGYLWSHPGGNAEWHGSSIGLFKAATPQDYGSAFESYDDGYYIEGRAEGNPISALTVVYVPPPRPDEPEDEELADDNGTATPPSEGGEEGEAAVPEANGTDRVVAVWHERARDWQNSTSGHSAWIEAAITDTGGRNNWTRQQKAQLVGPCKDASNAVAWRGDVYVACVVEKGYKARARARIGDIDLWRIDALSGNSSHLGFSGVRGGHPQIAINPDGYMVLVSADPYDPERPLGISVRVNFGWYGSQWGTPREIGPDLHAYAGGTDITDAHVTAVALSDDQKTALVVYKERQVPTAASPPPTIDPQNPPTPEDLTAIRLKEFKKVVLSFNECEPAIAAAAMELGTGLDAYQLENYAISAGAFNDIQDGLQTVRDASGAELFYFAINDYGAMQYGAIDVASSSAPCFVAPPIPAPPVPALPQALSVANPANLVVGATVGTVAIAMVSYLLAVKRKAAHALAAKAK